jgi:hypothetical protein
MSYKLQEFDKDYIVSGLTKLDTVKPLGNISLDSNSDGSIIVNLNDDTQKENLIPLYSIKVNNEQFQNVLDTEFTEFNIPALDRTPLLEAEIEALRSDRNRLAALYRDSNNTVTSQTRIIDDFTNRKFSDRLYRSFAITSNNNPSKLMSKNRRYILFMQTDGNLVVYRAANENGFDVNAEGALGDVVWSSQTGGRSDGPYRAIYQNDTNFVIYNNRNTPIWAAFNVADVATPNSILVLRDNGSLQIVDESNPSDTRIFFQRP